MEQLSPRARQAAMADAADLRPSWFDDACWHTDQQEIESRLDADQARARARQRYLSTGGGAGWLASQGIPPPMDMSAPPAAEDGVEDETSDDDSGNDSDTSTGGGVINGNGRCRMSPMGRTYSYDPAGGDSLDGALADNRATCVPTTALEHAHVGMMAALLIAMYDQFDNGIPPARLDWLAIQVGIINTVYCTDRSVRSSISANRDTDIFEYTY